MKPVELTSRAITDLKKIRSFINSYLERKKTEEIIDSIFSRIEMLENPTYNFSKIGSVDEDFNHLKREYRKLIQDHYKITYREGKSKIYVIRIFDTRQNPSKNK